jgi:hypothetical protein
MRMVTNGTPEPHIFGRLFGGTIDGLSQTFAVRTRTTVRIFRDARSYGLVKSQKLHLGFPLCLAGQLSEPSRKYVACGATTAYTGPTMSRRNSIRKRLEHHRATVAAERSREARRTSLLVRRTVKKEASKLAGELERVVQLQPESSSNASVGKGVDTVDDRSHSLIVDGFMAQTRSEGKMGGRIRKSNAERRKAAVRRKKIELRMKERMERDVDMFEDEDETAPPATFKLAISDLKHESGGENKTVSVACAPGTDREVGARIDSAAKVVMKVRRIRKSLAKQRREDRKRKLQILMRESIKASGHDDSS